MWEDKNTEWKEKDLYTVFYNIEEEEEKIIWERKYNNSETVDGNFFICIDAVVYVSREDDREEDDTEDIEEYHIKQSVTVDECVICYKNPPNVLYSNCLHLAVCNSCDKIGKFYKCPLCRTKIKNQRIKILKTSN